MKKHCALLALVFLLLSGCAAPQEPAQIAATTGPVYSLTAALCQGTALTVTRLVTENVSCLHDYSLSVTQARAAEAAQVIVISGGGLEDFMADILSDRPVIDSSTGIALLESCHNHAHAGHHHEADPHFWLSPACAKIMAQNICAGLQAGYPQEHAVLESNLQGLLARLDELQAYGQAQLSDLRCRELIPFHDGFSYFTQSFGLTVLKAVEEESGSEASASELKELIGLVRGHQLPAIFTEEFGSTSAARIISRETGVMLYTLTMAMSTEDYFAAMYRNIDTVKEALG